MLGILMTVFVRSALPVFNDLSDQYLHINVIA